MSLQSYLNVITHGDCLDVLRQLPDNSVNACVTDPPYGLSKEPDIREVLTKWLAGEPYDHGGGGFMGKAWDSFVPHPDVWREVNRVLKPGGHALVFAGTRTQDLMTIALRLGGFEIRDVIEWLYLSGFPKSMDVSKAFDRRFGAERQVIGQRTDGVGSDSGEGRYNWNNGKSRQSNVIDITAPATELAQKWDGWGTQLKPSHEPVIVARKPLEGTVVDSVEQYGTGAINIDGCRIGSRFPANCATTDEDAWYSEYFNVSAGATFPTVTPRELSKKASKRDRNSDWHGDQIPITNSHPTVKPVDLMAWLIRLVTPPGGVVLDPFAGSGTTPTAAKREGFDFIAIEQERDSVQIARTRVGA